MFIAILLLLVAGIAYTGWHFWCILPAAPVWKWVFVAFYLLSFLSTFVHYGLGDRLNIRLSAFTYWLGTSWVIFFLYALLLFLALDLGRLFHLVPAAFLRNSLAGTCSVFGLVVALLVYGGIHYHHKYREVIEIETDKPLEKPLTVVLASDLHVGYHNRKAELSRWVGLINAEKPDLVLFAGDILDGALRPARVWRYDEEFRRIAAPVYSCLGNHEYIASASSAVSFYSDAGIGLLRDSSVCVGGVRVIGRDDRSNRARKPLAELVGGASGAAFTILLDHQPYNLEEAEACGIDFQFSGHTHHGQIWPGNWLTDMLFEKAFGHHRRGGTRYYISSGLGIWGGKFRIGTRSEYVVLKLSSNGNRR